MGRKSSIDRLPPAVKKAIQSEISDGRLTLDEIKQLIEEEFGAEVSRSALGRYKMSVDEQMRVLRESREVADVWTKKFGEAPDSDIGKLVQEIIRTLAYRTSSDMLQSGEAVDPKQIAQLSRAMTYIENAGRLSQQRERELREAFEAEKREEAKKVLDGIDLKTNTAEALEVVRRALIEGQ